LYGGWRFAGVEVRVESGEIGEAAVKGKFGVRR